MRVAYRPVVVILSFGIAIMGSYSAISACEQYRLCRIGTIRSRYIPSWTYVVIMAVCLGGVGIWCMHFVGMSAVIMYDNSGAPVDVRYDFGLTLLSLLLVLFFSIMGLYISCHDVIFTKTKKEMLEMFVEDVQKISMKSVQHFGILNILTIILTKSTHRLLLGGAFTGSGVVIMHFVGMAAMKFPGRIVWSAGEVAASIIIAFVASTAAFWILFRLLSIYPNKENLRLSCSFVMSVAVCGMHYVGMFAATFHMDPTVSVDIANTFSAHDAYHAGIIVTALVASIATVIVLADLRYSVQRLSGELYKADALIKGFQTLPSSSPSIAIHRYIHHRRTTRFSLGVLNDTLQLENVDDDASSACSKDDQSQRTSVGKYLPTLWWLRSRKYGQSQVHVQTTEEGEGEEEAETTEHQAATTGGKGSKYHFMEQGEGVCAGAGAGVYPQVSLEPAALTTVPSFSPTRTTGEFECARPHLPTDDQQGKRRVGDMHFPANTCVKKTDMNNCNSSTVATTRSSGDSCTVGALTGAEQLLEE